MRKKVFKFEGKASLQYAEDGGLFIGGESVPTKIEDFLTHSITEAGGDPYLDIEEEEKLSYAEAEIKITIKKIEPGEPKKWN